MRWRTDLPSAFLEALVGYSRPNGNGRPPAGHHDRLLAEVPRIVPSDGMQEIYKKYVAFEYRTQYTDDMNGLTSCFDGASDLHLPFYDWEFVSACNRVPYKLGARRVFTLKSHSKMPVVQKYVLRKLLKGRLPDDLLYRHKATNPTLHCFFNRSVRPVVDRMLERWLPGLTDGLDDELRPIVAGMIEEYRQKTVFVRALDEPLLVHVLAICYVGMLHHLGTHRVAAASDELAALAEPATAVRTG